VSTQVNAAVSDITALTGAVEHLRDRETEARPTALWMDPSAAPLQPKESSTREIARIDERNRIVRRARK
jgi:hypothetical protein